MTFSDRVPDEEWVVQGRRGTNPLKVKSSKKTPSAAGRASDATVLAEKPAWIMENCLRNKREPGAIYGVVPRSESARGSRMSGPLIVKKRDQNSGKVDSDDPVGTSRTSDSGIKSVVRSSSTSKKDKSTASIKECCAVVPAVLPKDCEDEGVKKCAKERVGTVSVNKESKGYPKIKYGRYTLDWWKCYLESCASYYTFFVRKFLCHVQDSSSTMNGRCNAGTVLLRQKGWYKKFQVWLNENGIVNLLSIPMLEEAGYKVSTHTDRD